MFYSYEHDKNSLENLKLDLIEFEAYRELQNDEFEYFCFGVEDLYNRLKELKGSEDTYYKMEIQSLEEAILYYDINNPKPVKKKRKPRLNQYERKKITRQKIKDICSYYVVNERDGYLKRNYLTNHSNKYSRTVFYKKCSNIKVRRTNKFKLKGNSYRKVWFFKCWSEKDIKR